MNELVVSRVQLLAAGAARAAGTARAVWVIATRHFSSSKKDQSEGKGGR